MKPFAVALLSFGLAGGAAAAPTGCNCTVTSILFFDAGASALSPKTIAGIAADAQLYARQPPGPFTVTGGAAAAELATDPDLSRQRAEAVAAQLIADGVPAARVTIRDNGATVPGDFAGQLAVHENPRYVIDSFMAPTLRAAAAVPPPVVVPGPFQVMGLFLYEPNDVLIARLGQDPRPFGAYIGRVNAGIAALFAGVAPEPGVTAAIVIGVKPGGAVRSWIVTRPGTLPSALTAQMQAAIAAVPVVAVQGGPIAFAIAFNAWGGGAPVTDAQHPAPFPPEWRAPAGAAAETIPDGVFARIWP